MWHQKNLILSLSCIILLLLNYAAADDSTKESSVASGAAAFKDIPHCNAKDNNINECLSKNFDFLIQRAKNGIPEINVPPMDPFLLNKTSFIFSHPLIQGKVSARNLKFYGFSKTTARNMDYKRMGDEATAKFKALVPQLYVEGEYRASVKINAASIKSRGKFNVTLTNIDADIDQHFDVIKRDGHNYMVLKKFNLVPTVSDFKFYAEGLFPDPLLNDAALEFINQNWQALYKTFIAETRPAWEPEFVKLSNEYFSHVPVDALIKED